MRDPPAVPFEGQVKEMTRRHLATITVAERESLPSEVYRQRLAELAEIAPCIDVLGVFWEPFG